MQHIYPMIKSAYFWGIGKSIVASVGPNNMNFEIHRQNNLISTTLKTEFIASYRPSQRATSTSSSTDNQGLIRAWRYMSFLSDSQQRCQPSQASCTQEIGKVSIYKVWIDLKKRKKRVSKMELIKHYHSSQDPFWFFGWILLERFKVSWYSLSFFFFLHFGVLSEVSLVQWLRHHGRNQETMSSNPWSYLGSWTSHSLLALWSRQWLTTSENVERKLQELFRQLPGLKGTPIAKNYLCNKYNLVPLVLS